jgi:hypothetical protein
MMNKTTIETITEQQIQALYAEADCAGDYAQRELCEEALCCLDKRDRDHASVHACVAAINDAAAQDEADAHWASATLDAQRAR